MAKINFLEKINLILFISFSFLLTLAGCKPNTQGPLRLGISPYQDLAMIENYKHLGLDKKYNVNLDLVTLPFEEIIPSIGSAGKTIDVGFASYIEFITKSSNLNKDTKDSLLFIYPAYLFTGGGFTTFKKDFPVFNKTTIKDTALLKKFLSYKIGAQKNSMFDMAIYEIANYSKTDISSIKLTDITMDDGILGLQSGSLDFASAGLTQRNEVEKQGGKVVLDFNTMGFADITGFVCKKSVYEARKQEIQNMIKIWFDCVDYVLSDVDHHVTVATLPYLYKNAATKYTVASYKAAISQEIFPRSVPESETIVLADTTHFSAKHIYNTIADYLVKNKRVPTRPSQPTFIKIE